jgi:hypothetical protein
MQRAILLSFSAWEEANDLWDFLLSGQRLVS